MSETPSFWRADGDRKDLDCDGCGHSWGEHTYDGGHCPIEPESEVDALRATIATLRQEVVRLSSDQLVLLNVELAALRTLRDRLLPLKGMPRHPRPCACAYCEEADAIIARAKELAKP